MPEATKWMSFQTKHAKYCHEYPLNSLSPIELLNKFLTKRPRNSTSLPLRSTLGAAKTEPEGATTATGPGSSTLGAAKTEPEAATTGATGGDSGAGSPPSSAFFVTAAFLRKLSRTSRQYSSSLLSSSEDVPSVPESLGGTGAAKSEPEAAPPTLGFFSRRFRTFACSSCFLGAMQHLAQGFCTSALR